MPFELKSYQGSCHIYTRAFKTYRVKMIIPTGETDSKVILSKRYKPYTGESDTFNNHDCHHEKLEGSVFILNQDVFSDATHIMFVTDEKASVTIDLGITSKYSWPHTYRGPTKLTYRSFCLSDTNDRKVYLMEGRYVMESNYGTVSWFELLKFNWGKGTPLCGVINGSVTLSFGIREFDPNFPCSGTNWGDLCKYIPDISVKMSARDANFLVENLFLYNRTPMKRSMYKADLGRCSQFATADYDYLDINSSMYIADFFKLRQIVSSFLEIARKPTSPKAWAGMDLAYKYGISLFIKDTSDIAHSMKRAIHGISGLTTGRGCVTHSYSDSYYTVTDEFHCKLYLGNEISRKRKFLNTLYRWDFLPTNQNIWDYIPYSFVLDWFVNIEENLDVLDYTSRAKSLPLLRALYSIKRTSHRHLTDDQMRFNFPDAGWTSITLTGDYDYIYYDRWSQATAILPEFQWEVTYPGHVLTGIELLLTRKKR